jgi:ribosomal protein S17E
MKNWKEEFDKEFRFRSDVIAQDANYEGTVLRNDLIGFISELLTAQTTEMIEKISSLKMREIMPDAASLKGEGYNEAVRSLNSSIDSLIQSFTSSDNQ